MLEKNYYKIASHIKVPKYFTEVGHYN